MCCGIPIGNLQDRAMTELMSGRARPIYDRTQEHLGSSTPW